MKRLKQHWSARPLSGLLAVIYALVPVMLFLLSGGLPAQAQGTTRSAPPSFAVLDLVNRSGYGGAEVGRQAADAFVVELGKTNSYEVLDRQSTLKGIQDQGLTVPLDTIGLQKLGRGLQVTGVVTGEVAALSFSSSPRQATVSLILRVTDPVTGELINGAIAQGTSNGRAVSASDDDALVNQAIDNAAFAAVRQIRSFNLPKATILNSRDADTVLLNQGTRSGLSDGLNMVVTRSGQEVGRIRVSNADSDQSDAFVTNRGIGIQPGDRATAIYALPAYTISAGALRTDSGNISKEGSSSKSKHSKFSGIGGILIAVIAGALLLSLIKRGGGSGSLAGAVVGKPVAVAGRADDLGGGGILNTGFFFLGIGDPQPQDYVPIVVKITATTGNINASEFLEYHVYRSDNPASLTTGVFVNGTGTPQTPLVLSGFGQFPLLTDGTRGPLTIFDDVNPKAYFSATKPQSGVAGTTGGTTGTTGTTGGGNSGNGTVTLAIAGIVPGTGLLIGNRYQYFIEGLYLQPGTGTGPTVPGNNGGGTANTTGTTGTGGGNTGGNTGGTTGSNVNGHGPLFQLTSKQNTNFITYIEPVLFDSTNVKPNPISLDNINVNVRSTRGADDYILQIADNIGFRNAKTYRPTSNGPYTFPAPAGTTYSPRQGAVFVVFSLQNNSDLSSTFANASLLYFRVGARDSRNGSDSSGSPNPYIYSDPASVPLPGGPPPSSPSSRKQK